MWYYLSQSLWTPPENWVERRHWYWLEELLQPFANIYQRKDKPNGKFSMRTLSQTINTSITLEINKHPPNLYTPFCYHCWIEHASSLPWHHKQSIPSKPCTWSLRLEYTFQDFSWKSTWSWGDKWSCLLWLGYLSLQTSITTGGI